MIVLLVRRMLLGRPRRTLLLLFGFGIAVGVMITLLSIGAAVLEQSRDADLVGGGDLVLVPAGVDVEVLKVGAATGMFYSIDNAEFVYRHVLSGPRFQDRIVAVAAPVWPGEPTPPPLAAASPLLANEVVYVRRRAPAHAVTASSAVPRRASAFGVIPSLDRAVSGALVDRAGHAIEWADSHADRAWMEPAVDSLYHALDRFHRPPADRADLDTWAEWLYFNIQDPVSGSIAFVSFIAGGDWPSGRGRALPQVQLSRAPQSGAPALRVAGDWPLPADAIRTDRCDLRFAAGTTARFEGGRWHLAFDFATRDGHARGVLDVEPLRDVDYPPILIHDSDELVSGYVVPAIRARANGWIAIGDTRVEFVAAPAYHDHNWGTWRDVHWDWGTASTWEYGLFYGRVEHPELRPGRAGSGLFAMISRARAPGRRGGFVGLYRPDAIEYTWNDAPPALPGSPRRVPIALSFGVARGDTEHAATAANRAGASGDTLRVRATLTDVLATPPRDDRSPPRVFLQARGQFAVECRNIAGQHVRFSAPGFAETFVEPKAEPNTSARR